MNFENLIEQLTSSATTQNNYLTDGRLTCYYHQIPSIFEKFDSYLLANQINSSQGVALEGLNSVPGALILLYLLTKGYCFTLLPHRGKTPLKPVLPAICQYGLVVKSLPDSEIEHWYQTPERFLDLASNERYREESIPVNLTETAKLYLRTSGSMGNSKLVVHSHCKLFGNALSCTDRFQLKTEDRVFIPVPIFHMYGLGAGFLPSVIVGATIDLQEHSNIIKYLDQERQFNPTAAFLTPLLCQMLVQGRRSSRPYRLVVTAGDKIKEKIFRAFDAKFGGLVNLYGSTELGAAAACAPTDSTDLRATSAKPMAGVEMRVEEDFEGELNHDLPLGELYCKHQYGFEKYIDDHGHTIALATEWFKTGDLAEIQPTDYIKVLGRCDHSINRNGFLVLFSDLETVMEKIDQVEKVVIVTSKEEEKRGPKIVAFCVLKAGAMISATQLRVACFNLLPKYAIPDQVLIVDSLPTLPSGKLDRQTLMQMTESKPASQ